MAEVLQRLPNALGFCDDLGMDEGEVWIEPDGKGEKFIWQVQWLSDIVSDLVTWDNPAGGITNPYLELAALVLQDSCFPIICSRPN